MSVTQLQIQNFRRLQDVSLELGAGWNLFTGENAQGKTTLLEALRLLSTTRSFLTHAAREMMTRGSTHFFLKARLLQGGIPLELKCGVSREAKNFRVNDQPVKTLADFLGRLRTVLFLPTDTDLVTGEPETRRRYLDIPLSQAHEPYFQNLVAYHRVLKHRNHLLRTPFQKTEMRAWTDKLVEAGSFVVAQRSQAAEQIRGLALSHLKRFFPEKETFDMQYHSVSPSKDISVIRGEFRTSLENSATREKELGYTLHGPHRDDLKFFLNGSDARRHASRGQIKSIALSLRFAEAEILKTPALDFPVFLVDDVTAELDERRKRAFFESFSPGQQVLMTSTFSTALPSQLEHRFPVKTFTVREGWIEENTL